MIDRIARSGRGRAALAATLLAACAAGAQWGPGPPREIDRTDAPGRGPEAARTVVLVSVDGLAPRVLAATETPVWDRLVGEGVSAEWAETIVPSKTLPSHTSMLSGVGPDRHGVLWNTWKPDRAIRVDTVFSHCLRHRLRCGLFAGKPKFAHFAIPEPGVERYRLADEAEAVFDAALDYADEAVPHFLMVHLAEVDATGHRHGWGSEAQRGAIRRIDAALGEFLEELRDEREGALSLILTSDHGGRGRNHGSDHAHDVEIPWVAWGRGVPAGARVGRVRTEDTAATVLSLLGLPVPQGWVGKSHHPF